jgi:tetratricopeptide (TPR) repeat protein
MSALRPWALVLLLAVASAAHALPFTPARDSDVVERLPLASDPSVRGVESLRKQLAARPNDAALRVDIAQRYFDLAMAQGDPRFVGYASAAIAPLAANPNDNAGYWLVRGLIQQFSHDFEAALSSLGKASEVDPRSPAALSWRAAIFMVQARYPEALAECARLAPLAEPLLGAGCSAYARSMTGPLLPTFEALNDAVKAAPHAAPSLLLWQYTRLAEMAWRLQRHALAESHFRNALALGITDQFLLGAYTDFLLAQQRPGEVLKLLAGWERSDILLLRLALAGQATSDARTSDWIAQLRDRFQAAARRGDRLHEQEAARFELDLERDAAKALELATRNYQVQKEPRDAEILMRAALAAGQAKAARAALDWLRSNGYQDPVLGQLADQLAAQGASR